MEQTCTLNVGVPVVRRQDHKHVLLMGAPVSPQGDTDVTPSASRPPRPDRGIRTRSIRTGPARPPTRRGSDADRKLLASTAGPSYPSGSRPVRQTCDIGLIGRWARRRWPVHPAHDRARPSTARCPSRPGGTGHGIAGGMPKSHFGCPVRGRPASAARSSCTALRSGQLPQDNLPCIRRVVPRITMFSIARCVRASAFSRRAFPTSTMRTDTPLALHSAKVNGNSSGE